MLIGFLIFFREKLINSKVDHFLKKVGLYPVFKKIYRFFVFLIGRRGLKLKIKDTSAKIIVSSAREIEFYYYQGNEKELLENFLKRITPQTVFYDVGAYIGLYSLAAAKYKISPKFIYCWEPEPHNFKRLLENIKLNKIKNILPFPVALGSENGIFEMFLENEEPYLTTASFARKSSKSIPIQVVKGDDWVFQKKLYLPSIIKIDVEGYELNVLKGFEKTIKECKPIVFLEIHPEYIKNLRQNREMVLDFLRKIGYKVTYFSSRKKLTEHYILEKLDK